MKKGSVFLLVLFVILSAFSRNVYADMGPKPSVTVTVENAPDKEYYVTLLSSAESYGPWSKVEGDASGQYSGEKEEAFVFFASYKDPDGFCFLGNMDDASKTENSFHWGYYPPEEFKVAIYCPEDGSFYVSDICERYAFESYYTVRYGTSPLEIREVTNYGKMVRNFLIRVISTIAVELFIAFVMGYRSRKEMVIILIVNIITQVLLNAFLIGVDYFGGGLVWMILFPLGELIVFIVELIIYLFTLKSHSKGRAFFYTLLANLCSAALTFASEIIFWSGM